MNSVHLLQLDNSTFEIKNEMKWNSLNVTLQTFYLGTSNRYLHWPKKTSHEITLLEKDISVCVYIYIEKTTLGTVTPQATNK